MTAETAQPALDAADFEALYQRLRRVPCWGPADRRGALNHLTQDRVLAAAGEIRLGRTVSLAAPIETGLTPDDPAPAIHEMAGPPGNQADPAGLTFAQDRLGINALVLFLRHRPAATASRNRFPGQPDRGRIACPAARTTCPWA
jgi:hypothetical protein